MVMVRVRVRFTVAVRAVVPLQCLDAIYSELVRGSEHPRGMPLVTRMEELEAEEQRRGNQWHPRV